MNDLFLSSSFPKCIILPPHGPYNIKSRSLERFSVRVLEVALHYWNERSNHVIIVTTWFDWTNACPLFQSATPLQTHVFIKFKPNIFLHIFSSNNTKKTSYLNESAFGPPSASWRKNSSSQNLLCPLMTPSSAEGGVVTERPPTIRRSSARQTRAALQSRNGGFGPGPARSKLAVCWILWSQIVGAGGRILSSAALYGMQESREGCFGHSGLFLCASDFPAAFLERSSKFTVKGQEQRLHLWVHRNTFDKSATGFYKETETVVWDSFNVLSCFGVGWSTRCEKNAKEKREKTETVEERNSESADIRATLLFRLLLNRKDI